MKPDALLVMTHRGPDGAPLTPHIEAFAQSNPGLPHHLIVSEETGESREVLWRNGDRPLPGWWRSNAPAGEIFAVAEWDTLITVGLPAMPDRLDMVGRVARLMPPSLYESSRHPALRTGIGPNKLKLIAHLGSFGFIMVRRWVLDAISKTEWETIYAMDIRNELRTPSVAVAEGARIGFIPLPGVLYKGAAAVAGPGIYHPVKPG